MARPGNQKTCGLVFAVLLCWSLAVSHSWAIGLGDQRIGTASASFLRIGVGARAAGMGGAFVAVCDDVTSVAWNPAGLVLMDKSEIAFTYASWPADIGYSHLAFGTKSRLIDGAIGLQFGVLSTEMMETQEYYPYGTGRTFSFSDWLVGLTVAKRFTDRFSGGVAVKYVREELGVEVGGPTTNAIVLDAGTYYRIGPWNMRLAVALMNFGTQLTPGGSYHRENGSEITEADYDGFSPAMEFKFGISMMPWDTPDFSTLFDIELVHPADNAETIRMGLEARVLRVLALRAGYDLNADEMKTSFGAGVLADILGHEGGIDYAATLSEYLGSVHRLSLVFKL
ncbi:MAG: PorV/PorQ family protein [bacterium]